MSKTKQWAAPPIHLPALDLGVVAFANLLRRLLNKAVGCGGEMVTLRMAVFSVNDPIDFKGRQRALTFVDQPAADYFAACLPRREDIE